MKNIIILTLTLILSCIQASAQKSQIYGKVVFNGEPIENACVMELDANHRMLNQTQTDASGFFTLPVSGDKTSIRVTYNGMKRFTQKIGTRKSWDIELEEDTDTESKRKVKAKHETKKLIVGHLQGRVIPQITWVEQLTDSTFCIIIPIRVFSGVEEYPKGRRLVVQNYNSHAMAIGTNIENAMPEEGAPESWDPFVRTSTNNSTDNNSQFTTNDRDYFCYPRFLFSRRDLEYLIDHSKEIACFAADTSRGDNYWTYYMSKSFPKEMQKILNKMLK